MEMDRKCLVTGCQMRTLERNRDAWKIVEGSMPGNCQGRHAKEVKNKLSRQLTGHGGKGKNGKGCPVAGCVASACKSGHRGASDPVVRDTAEGLGPEGLPSGIRPAALCRGPLPTMRYTFALRQAGPTLIRGEGFPDLFRRFLAAF